MRFVITTDQFYTFISIARISLKLNIEISGFLIYIIKGEKIILKDIIIPEQSGSSTHTSIDKKEIAKIALSRKKSDRVGFFHTHLGNFGHSGFDERFGYQTANDWINPFLSVVATTNTIYVKIWERVSGKVLKNVVVSEFMEIEVKS